MPIYEYRCESCGHELETIQGLSDEPLRDCPACGEPQLRRLLSRVGFRLKGGGWYETDFKSGGRKNVAESGEGGGSSEQGSGGKDQGGSSEKGGSSGGSESGAGGSGRSGSSGSSGKSADSGAS